MSDATVRCWGSNRFAQLGDGTTTAHAAPTVITGLAGVAQIAAGGGHACARMTDGSVQCWGDNDNGEIGDGSTNAADPASTTRVFHPEHA